TPADPRDDARTRVGDAPLDSSREDRFQALFMACVLQTRSDMNSNPNRWRRLSPTMVTDLPEEAAVFEIANLVRTVHLIGDAEGNLRTRLTGFLGPNTALPPSPGGYYFRYEIAAAEKEALAERMAAFQAKHRGQLPPPNRGAPPACRSAPRRAAGAADRPPVAWRRRPKVDGDPGPPLGSEPPRISGAVAPASAAGGDRGDGHYGVLRETQH